jgi:hypothetical protein
VARKYSHITSTSEVSSTIMGRPLAATRPETPVHGDLDRDALVGDLEAVARAHDESLAERIAQQHGRRARAQGGAQPLEQDPEQVVEGQVRQRRLRDVSITRSRASACSAFSRAACSLVSAASSTARISVSSAAQRLLRLLAPDELPDLAADRRRHVEQRGSTTSSATGRIP